MLPISYQMPAAVVVAVVGLMACVAGFRLLRYVLAAFGFCPFVGFLAAPGFGTAGFPGTEGARRNAILMQYEPAIATAGFIALHLKSVSHGIKHNNAGIVRCEPGAGHGLQHGAVMIEIQLNLRVGNGVGKRPHLRFQYAQECGSKTPGGA